MHHCRCEMPLLHKERVECTDFLEQSVYLLQLVGLIYASMIAKPLLKVLTKADSSELLAYCHPDVPRTSMALRVSSTLSKEWLHHQKR